MKPQAMEFTIPLRTVSGLNVREHWATRARRVKKERHATALAWAMAIGRRQLPQLPLLVVLTRVGEGTRPLDSDNLPGACKAVRDALAACLGVDDGDARVEWRYAQARGPWGVRVSVEAVP